MSQRNSVKPSPNGSSRTTMVSDSYRKGSQPSQARSSKAKEGTEYAKR